MKKASLILMATLLLLGCPWAPKCWASDDEVGTSAAQVLKLGSGARALALGGAFSGLADDVTAVSWNPAGLACVQSWQVTFMHRSLYQDLSFESAAFAHPLGQLGVAAVNLNYLHMDRMEGRDQMGEPTSQFGSDDLCLVLGLGFRAGTNFLLGGSVKYLSESIEDYTAHAVAFDLGWLCKTPWSKLRLGGAVQNLGGEMKFVSESFELPTLLKLGLALSDTLGRAALNVATDYWAPSDNGNSLRAGAECVYANLVAVRIGYNGSPESDSDARLSWGMGLMFAGTHTYCLDYCFTPAGDLGDSHAVSLTLHF
jgi:hypothetical protein